MLPDNRGTKLNGWGEIASHLGCDIRTAQRWDKSQGLPIHRHPGPKPRVWAYSAELDAWWDEREKAGLAANAPPADAAPLEERLLERRPRFRVWRAAGIALALSILSAGAYSVHRVSTPDSTPLKAPDRIFAAADSDPSLIQRIPVRGQPVAPKLTRDGRTLYVMDNPLTVDLQAINTETHSVRDIAGTTGASAFAIGADGRAIYVGMASGGLRIVDADTGKSTAIRDGIDSRVIDLLLTPDEKYLYLTLELAGLARLNLRNGQLNTVFNDRCPGGLALDATANTLYVSCGCGPGKKPVHDTVEAINAATGETVRVYKGPPMISGPVWLSPSGDRIWVSGLDACQNPRYRSFALDCPVYPGSVTNVFRSADGSVSATLGMPIDRDIGAPLFFPPDGQRAVVGGSPPRVLDANRYFIREALTSVTGELSLALDFRRHKMYLASIRDHAVYIAPVPANDCDPPRFARSHLWTFDGTLNDVTGFQSFEGKTDPIFQPGLVGAAIALTGASFSTETPYGTLDRIVRQDGSLEGWIKATSVKGGTVAEMDSGGAAMWRLSVNSSGFLVFESNGRPPVPTRQRLALASWTHFAVVAKNRRFQIYFNGVPSAEGALSDISPRGDRTLTVGPLDGLLDELAMYDRPLASSEVKAIVAASASCVAQPANGGK